MTMCEDMTSGWAATAKVPDSKGSPNCFATYGPVVTTNGISSCFFGRNESILEMTTMNVSILSSGNSGTSTTLLIIVLLVALEHS